MMNIFFNAINPEFYTNPNVYRKSIKLIYSIKIDKMNFKGFLAILKFMIKILAK